MRISYNSLEKLVELPDDVNELIARFTQTGTEVEGLETSGAQFDNIVTAKVVSKEKHPDSDHMWVTMVDVGEDEPLQIVCGAQNFNEGDHIVTAKIGAVLPGDFKIKKSKLRGVASNGMNCSGKELGISSDHEGIMILPEDAPIGMPFAQYAKLSDYILELEPTPNRPDQLSLYGIAREVGVILDTPFGLAPRELKEDSASDINQLVSVEIEEPGRCHRYVARIIKNVKVGPSPEWLAHEVTKFGARPINNVVDVTNYILFLLGQPLHAFDYDALTKDASDKAEIVVRPARSGEKLTTLDNQERELIEDMTVIGDKVSGKALALAGVMGGLESEVSDTTTTVFLETASFSSSHTSRTSRNLQLFSESSLRFERGVDQNQCGWIADYAASLMAEVCGGEVVLGKVDVFENPIEPQLVPLRMDRLRSFVGADIKDEEGTHYLELLGCEVTKTGEHSYEVETPSFRPDLEREVDLHEEVLRLWGMERVLSTLPAAQNHFGGLTEEQKLENQIAQSLRSLGLSETVTYSIVAADDLERLKMPETGKGLAVELINPMSEEQAVMRRSLIPGLLKSVAHNQAHSVKNVHLYEQGTVFFAEDTKQQPKEKTYVSAVLSGKWQDDSWSEKASALDFFDAKGIVEQIISSLKLKKVLIREAKPEEYTHLQPGRAAEILIAGAVVGWIGEIHPRVLKDFEIEGAVAAFELDQDALLKQVKTSYNYGDVPKLPAVEMDIAFVVDEDMPQERIAQMISSAGGKILESVRLFDVYRDAEKLGQNKKSLAYKLVYRSSDHTLSSEEVEKAHNKVIDKVTRASGASQRA